MQVFARHTDRHRLPAIHTRKGAFMINEDGVRSLGSATISRRRLLGGLAGSAIALGGGRCCRAAREPRHRPVRAVPLPPSQPASVPRRPTTCRNEPLRPWSTHFSKKSSDTITINTVPHNDFQNNINNYLQGSPDDAFTWFAGYRMRYFAAQGLVAPLDDVWQGSPATSPRAHKASTGDDGKKYFVPNYNYPWGFFYRKSVWQDKGYRCPATFDDLKSLARR